MSLQTLTLNFRFLTKFYCFHPLSFSERSHHRKTQVHRFEDIWVNCLCWQTDSQAWRFHWTPLFSGQTSRKENWVWLKNNGRLQHYRRGSRFPCHPSFCCKCASITVAQDSVSDFTHHYSPILRCFFSKGFPTANPPVWMQHRALGSFCFLFLWRERVFWIGRNW